MSEDIPKEYNLIKDGDTLPFADGIIKCIHTPGHTKGGMCYLYKDAIFTGDTLFKGSVGRSDFIGGDKKFGNICWITSMRDDCPPQLVLKKDYRLEDYKRFNERPDIINIDTISDIPSDYYDVIPTTSVVRNSNNLWYFIFFSNKIINA